MYTYIYTNTDERRLPANVFTARYGSDPLLRSAFQTTSGGVEYARFEKNHRYYRGAVSSREKTSDRISFVIYLFIYFLLILLLYTYVIYGEKINRKLFFSDRFLLYMYNIYNC